MRIMVVRTKKEDAERVEGKGEDEEDEGEDGDKDQNRDEDEDHEDEDASDDKGCIVSHFVKTENANLSRCVPRIPLRNR
jgi:hypothetical protein